MAISFAMTRAELDHIERIVARASSLAISLRLDMIEPRGLMMDLAATNNVCPINLPGLLDADDVNFVHDVFGIHRHFDRTTGQLGDGFTPRFSKVTPDDVP